VGKPGGLFGEADWCILDLDPKTRPLPMWCNWLAPSTNCVAEFKLPCFAKTSGGSGLHVLIPLAGQLTHAESRTLAQLFGQVMVREHPDLAP